MFGTLQSKLFRELFYLVKYNMIFLIAVINKHFGHSFAFDAPTVWNDLPDEVRSLPTLACFRKG